MSTKNPTKIPQEFKCLLCDYTTCYLKDFKKHTQTKKHKNNEINGQINSLGQNTKIYKCENCDKNFTDRSGLWRHKNSSKCVTDCKNNDTNAANKIDISNKDDLIIMLIKENKEFKSMLMEQHTMMMKILENGTHTTTHNTTHTNSHNKAFNLNFFLNETCKNAMNITDFIDSIKIQLSDLERFGEVGYAEGISKIITSNLKALDVTERPIHCTDKKRETMYVKDNNKWEKEDENNTKLRKFIKNVSYKNIKLLPQFREKNPEYKNSSSHISGKYDKMALEAMGGAGDESEKENKIIHNISKCVIVDKLRDDE